jgi:hypothetical protein
MAGFKLEGFDKYREKLQSAPANMQRTVDAYVQDAALSWEQRAKRTAPVDFGRLKGGIVSSKTGQMAAEIVSGMKYSPYVEWGTGTRVSVPAELQSYAIQFKGVNKVVGRFPKPFFFIQKPIIQKELIAKIENYLKDK